MNTKEILNNKTLHKAWRAAYLQEESKDDNVGLLKICDTLDFMVEYGHKKGKPKLSLPAASILVNGTCRMLKKKADQLFEGVIQLHDEMIESSSRHIEPVSEMSSRYVTSTSETSSKQHTATSKIEEDKKSEEEENIETNEESEKDREMEDSEKGEINEKTDTNVANEVENTDEEGEETNGTHTNEREIAEDTDEEDDDYDDDETEGIDRNGTKEIESSDEEEESFDVEMLDNVLRCIENGTFTSASKMELTDGTDINEREKTEDTDKEDNNEETEGSDRNGRKEIENSDEGKEPFYVEILDNVQKCIQNDTIGSPHRKRKSSSSDTLYEMKNKKSKSSNGDAISKSKISYNADRDENDTEGILDNNNQSTSNETMDEAVMKSNNESISNETTNEAVMKSNIESTSNETIDEAMIKSNNQSTSSETSSYVLMDTNNEIASNKIIIDPLMASNIDITLNEKNYVYSKDSNNENAGSSISSSEDADLENYTVYKPYFENRLTTITEVTEVESINTFVRYSNNNKYAESKKSSIEYSESTTNNSDIIRSNLLNDKFNSEDGAEGVTETNNESSANDGAFVNSKNENAESRSNEVLESAEPTQRDQASQSFINRNQEPRVRVDSLDNDDEFDKSKPFGYILIHDSYYSRVPSKIVVCSFKDDVRRM